MEEAGLAEIVRITPDSGSAIFALGLASEAIERARERFFRGDYRRSLEESRNAMRLASSALLFRDGYVSDSLEATIYYMLQHYPGSFPLDSWVSIERIPTGETPGLYYMVLGALGRLKKAGEEEAKIGIAAAEMFLESARTEIS
jgi:uncharacterized protein (UPF0332 family)